MIATNSSSSFSYKMACALLQEILPAHKTEKHSGLKVQHRVSMVRMLIKIMFISSVVLLVSNHRGYGLKSK